MRITRTGAAAIGAAGIGALAAALLAWRRSRGDDCNPGSAAMREGEGLVRNAGPDGMRSKVRDWSREDEASDESFPASDPPASW